MYKAPLSVLAIQMRSQRDNHEEIRRFNNHEDIRRSDNQEEIRRPSNNSWHSHG